MATMKDTTRGLWKTVRRKYNLRTPQFVAYIVTSLKSVPHSLKVERLDNYELMLIGTPTKFAKKSSLEEIIYILQKLNVSMGIFAMDYENPLRNYKLTEAVRGFTKDKDIKKVIQTALDHNFFLLFGRDMMKVATFYSQLLNGEIFVPNRDYATFLKAGNDDRYDTNSVDEVILNILTQDNSDLERRDIAIMLLLKKFDMLPISQRAIYDMVYVIMSKGECKRIIRKLVNYGYVEIYQSVHNAGLYGLSAKGWLKIAELRKGYFKGIRFYSAELIKKTKQQNNERTNAEIEN